MIIKIFIKINEKNKWAKSQNAKNKIKEFIKLEKNLEIN